MEENGELFLGLVVSQCLCHLVHSSGNSNNRSRDKVLGGGDQRGILEQEHRWQDRVSQN